MQNRQFSTPEEFERRVAQITELLEYSVDSVTTWNARIPDPDNPTQARQIDVLVTREDQKTLIECRHHSRPQDVKWVEELCGRRLSLRASQVIAVSSSGFTTGAIKKAESLGVFLRTLSEVSDEEVSSWGCRSTVTLQYVMLSNVKVYFVCGDHLTIPINEKLVRNAFRGMSLAFILSMFARDVARFDAEEGPIVSCILDAEGIFLGSVAIRELYVAFVWRRISREQALPVVMCYEDPLAGQTDGIQANSYSGTAIAHSKGEVSCAIDVSVMSFSPNSILTGARVDFGGSVRLRKVGIIGLEAQPEGSLNTEFESVSRDSSVYPWLKNSSRGQGSKWRKLGETAGPQGPFSVLEFSAIFPDKK